MKNEIGLYDPSVLYLKIKDLMGNEVSEVSEDIKLEMKRFIEENIKPEIDKTNYSLFTFMFSLRFEHEIDAATHGLADWLYNFSFYHLGKSPLAWYACYCIASLMIQEASDYETPY